MNVCVPDVCVHTSVSVCLPTTRTRLHAHTVKARAGEGLCILGRCCQGGTCWWAGPSRSQASDLLGIVSPFRGGLHHLVP